MDALLHRRVVKLPALGSYLDTHNGWPGTAQLREVLTLAEPLSESPMETRLRLVLHDAGLPPLTAQHDVYGTHPHRGRVFLGRVDLAYPGGESPSSTRVTTTGNAPTSSATWLGSTHSARRAGWCCASPRTTHCGTPPELSGW